MSQVYYVTAYITDVSSSPGSSLVSHPPTYVAVEAKLFGDKAGADAYVAKLQAALEVLVGTGSSIYKLVTKVSTLEVTDATS